MSQVVRESVRELTRGKTKVEFAIKEVTAVILKKYPNFNQNTVNAQITADTVNHPSRHHHSTPGNRYWRISTGKYRLYDREKDKIEE